MTPEKILAIRERAEKATSGPWKYIDQGNVLWADGFDLSLAEEFSNRLDAEFIAYAREDVPALCDALEQAQAALDNPRANLLFTIHNQRSEINELLSLGVGMRKENARLRKALEWIQLHRFYVSEMAYSVARDALGNEGKSYDEIYPVSPAEQENQRLRKALGGLLLSADCTWEERDEGHDWKEACEFAREILKGGASE